MIKLASESDRQQGLANLASSLSSVMSKARGPKTKLQLEAVNNLDVVFECNGLGGTLVAYAASKVLG